ncbi:hypothetical protein [Salinirubrum litoreum]|uniref:Ig-like domain-containing protein n=1 Tax=Salinirubrum litoreum TaxID=1126234 RepID=A0ABD5RDK7_9EURY|nr:hypothetical protein [Salinirubrum litoreum]
MNRRRLLGLVGAAATPGLAVGLAGCNALEDVRSAGERGTASERAGDGENATGPDPDAAATTASLPYDDGSPVTPRGITVRNVAETAAYVTLAVETDAGEQVFVSSERLGGRRFVGYDALVAAEGEYRVVVETAAGERAETTWRVTDSQGDLGVTVGDGVTIQQTVRCAPDCVLAEGGTAVGYPAGDFDPRGRRDDTTLRVVNPAAGTETATRIRVGTDDQSVLDYRYEHPAGVTLELPVPQYAGELPITITAGDRERRFDWRPQVTPSLRAILADSIQFRCGVGNRDLQVLNPDDATSEVAVRVFSAAGESENTTQYEDERPLFAETVTVPPSGSVERSDVIASAGRYRVEVVVGGDAVEAIWETCPPRGALIVVVGETSVSSVRVGSDAVTTNPVGRSVGTGSGGRSRPTLSRRGAFAPWDRPVSMNRRRLLRLAALGATGGSVSLAGCGERAWSPPPGFGRDDDRQKTATAGSDDPADTGEGATATDDRPDLPYTGGDDPVDRARTLRVRNPTLTAQFVTVVVEHGDRTVYVDSANVPPNATVEHSRLLGSTGTYRVVIETAAGRRLERDWRIEGVLGGLDCLLADPIEAVQVARCAPDCPPLSRGGTETGLAFDDPSGLEPWSGTTLELTNRTGTTREVSLTITGRRDRRLDYDYRLPGWTRVFVPLVSGGGQFAVELTSDGETARYDWSARETRALFTSVTASGPLVGCTGGRADAVAVNQSGASVTLSVRIARDGTDVADATFTLAPGERRDLPDVFAGTGPFALDLSTDAGSEASYRFPICPDTGPVYLVVEPDGTVTASATAP